MEFTLYYRGDLKANCGAKEKHRIRRRFHPQLKLLWKQLPLDRVRDLLNPYPAGATTSIIQHVGPYTFAPLITEKLHLIAEIAVTMLRPDQHGSIVGKGGDLDNRLKTLLDALRLPSDPNGLPANVTPGQDEVPFFCLLKDDKLVTKVTMEAHQLLEPEIKPME